MTADQKKSVKPRVREAKAESTPKRAPAALLAVSWFIPGLGHWILGRRTRAVVFATVVV